MRKLKNALENFSEVQYLSVTNDAFNGVDFCEILNDFSKCRLKLAEFFSSNCSLGLSDKIFINTIIKNYFKLKYFSPCFSGIYFSKFVKSFLNHETLLVLCFYNVPVSRKY